MYHNTSKSLTQRSQICDVVVDILDGEWKNFDAHPAHIGGRNLTNEAGELVSVLIDLLDGQCACNN